MITRDMILSLNKLDYIKNILNDNFKINSYINLLFLKN
jgi:hypothetical protein